MCTKYEFYFLLVDCNNFFVSCERVFNPTLQGVPVVVLSNNDGCIISRSNEAKTLGVPMGVPIYKQQEKVNRYGIKVYSSNYALYGDISNRVMACLEDFTDKLEIYSIDEAFLTILDTHREKLENYAAKIRRAVLQWTGVPVSIGLGRTKTLAKIANAYVKKFAIPEGFLVLHSSNRTDEILTKMEVSEVWGVGRRSSEKLREYGIDTAFDLARAPNKFIRQKFNVLLARTQLELAGKVCFSLENVLNKKKSLVVSRSFGSKIKTRQELEEAVSTYAIRAGEKIRRKRLKARIGRIFIRTNTFSTIDEQYCNSLQFAFPDYTNDTGIFIINFIDALRKIYRSGYMYSKAGVVLLDLLKDEETHSVFFRSQHFSDCKPDLMQRLDFINKKYGRDTVTYAVSGIDKRWFMRSVRKSPNYTGDWEEILKIK